MCECIHCGNIHQGKCPRIKAIEYYENGGIKRVEYFGDNENLPMLPTYGFPKPVTYPPIPHTYPVTVFTDRIDTASGSGISAINNRCV